jgi:hypothetical protein
MNGAAITSKILKGLYISSNVGHVLRGERAGIELGHRRVGCFDYPDNLRERSFAPLVRERWADALCIRGGIMTNQAILCEELGPATAVRVRSGRALM